MYLRSFLLFVFAFQLSYGETEKFTTTELMQNETRATVALLERLHISKKQMPEVDTKEVIITYCENLDILYVTIPPKEITATSVVPPPISTIKFPPAS